MGGMAHLVRAVGEDALHEGVRDEVAGGAAVKEAGVGVVGACSGGAWHTQTQTHTDTDRQTDRQTDTPGL